MKSKPSHVRLWLVFSLITLAWLALTGRLLQIQVVHGEDYAKIAKSQSQGEQEIAATRGIIYDRTGRELALNITRQSLYAYPADQDQVKSIEKYLDRVYHRKSGTTHRKYSLKPEKFAYIERRLNDSLAVKIAADSIKGLYLTSEDCRSYPFDKIGRRLLGVTNIDGKGISGMEYFADSLLSGTPGLVDYIRDGNQKTYRLRDNPLVSPVPGYSLVLTVDWYFQEIVEAELKAAVDTHNAVSGSAIFLDCRTGEILAATDYTRGDSSGPVKLRAVSDCFEPGSAAKIVAAAAVLDEGKARPFDKEYCEHGSWRLDGRNLHDDKKLDTLTFRNIVVYSSNIGIAKMALRLGDGEKLAQAYHRFGFGQKTQIDFPGEAGGMVADPGVWSRYNTAALAMGHAVMVTPLQLATSMAAVANGGDLVRPQVIGGIIDSEGKIIRKMEKEVIGQAMKKESAAILREFLKGVVDTGTGHPAKSEIISLAGKTGTAQIPDPQNGGYLSGKYNATFAGFFPAENPAIAGVVVINQPEPIHYGGYTAAPAFKKMAEKYVLAHTDKLRPDSRLIAQATGQNGVTVPNMVGTDLGLAVRVARDSNLEVKTNCEKGLVVWQYPPAERSLAGVGLVALVAQDEFGDAMRMVDLVGTNLRTALAVLEYQGLTYEIIGGGIVREQNPPPGTSISTGMSCRLVCGQGNVSKDSTEVSESGEKSS